MACIVEINATFLASDPDRRTVLGYKGGNLECPHNKSCDGNNCKLSSDNFRTIGFLQETKPVIQPTQTDKFYQKLEKHESIVAARSQISG